MIQFLKRGTLLHCWWEWRFMQPLWKAVWSYLKKLKMELPYDSEISLLVIYLKKPETIIQQNIRRHPYVHCNTIYNSQDLEAAQMSISRWVYKTTMVYLHDGILLNRKKEENFTLHNSMGEPGEHYAKWNKPENDKCHMISLICGI